MDDFEGLDLDLEEISNLENFFSNPVNIAPSNQPFISSEHTPKSFFFGDIKTNSSLAKNQSNSKNIATGINDHADPSKRKSILSHFISCSKSKNSSQLNSHSTPDHLRINNSSQRININNAHASEEIQKRLIESKF
ncbi:hypothetical protein AYI70_g997 [Smittium culicis]|uniref:Uncharacterized protein n=1 Tax=Smittium culicis TaxID=133412 RepID=A0A1R1WYM6_9FUNG|nr:hypothetical protein AYI70_g12156 [Smittium culicis]OMJ25291.1 hypothetical protein AYI70_g997 [Smittium culicis]